MVTRKSDGGPPAGKDAARPGSYVKISGSRRRRKGKKQGAGAAAASSASPTAPRGEIGKDADDDALAYAVDDLRRPKAPSGPRPSWRPPGPLGMDEPRIDAAGAEEHPVAGAPETLQQVGLRATGEPDNHNQAPSDGLTPEQQAQIDEELARQLSEPPPPRVDPPRDPDAVRPAVLLRDEVHPVIPLGEEVARPSLSSVLGARPSMRPSPAPPPTRISLLMWIAIAVLVAIIAAAAVVAVRETLRGEPVPTRSEPAARPLLPSTPPVLHRMTPIAPETLLAPSPAPAGTDTKVVPTAPKHLPARPVRLRRPAAAPSPPASDRDENTPAVNAEPPPTPEPRSAPAAPASPDPPVTAPSP